jgi:hypothetical protein
MLGTRLKPGTPQLIYKETADIDGYGGLWRKWLDQKGECMIDGKRLGNRHALQSRLYCNWRLLARL